MKRSPLCSLLTLGVGALVGYACGGSTSRPIDGGSGGAAGSTVPTGGSNGTGGLLGAGGNSAKGSTGGAAGSSASGGAPGAGGSSVGSGGLFGSGGRPGAGGVLGGGGASGAGGDKTDAGTGVACTDDGGVSLPGAARRCTRDSDCTIAIAARCCGPDLALGEEASQAASYASCLALPPGACQGLGCAKYLGYATDTGKLTAATVPGPLPASIAVHCASQLCTTDVVDGVDASRDAPPPDGATADVALDTPRQTCRGTLCGPREACVQVTGGTQEPCTSPGDGGTCAPGLTLLNTCHDYTTGIDRQPGCTRASSSAVPLCTPLPDGCDGTCPCVCPSGGGIICTTSGDYFVCALP